MKKITLLAVAFVALAAVSCKKERECVCTTTSNGVSIVSTTKVKSGKKDATSWCEASNGSKTTTTVDGVSVPYTSNGTTCSIK